jgi:hypothetical protein
MRLVPLRSRLILAGTVLYLVLIFGVMLWRGISIEPQWVMLALLLVAIASAAWASTVTQRRKPRFGSCDHGTGPKPFHPLRRSASSPRW